MNAAVIMHTCPSEEILAAFIDERLDAKTRLEVVEHLAGCGDCRDVVVAANEIGMADAAETGKVVRGRFRPRVLAPLVAAAAVLVVLFGVAPIRERLLGRSGMPALVEAADSLPERATYARLSGDFAYKEKRTMRGGDDSADSAYRIQIAASKSAERAEKSPTAKNLHEYGVASILTGQRDEAVAVLQRAANVNPASADLLTDLAAAHLARGRENDAELAYAAATKAWSLKQTPAAAWNRAFALEKLERDAEAIAAWREYLELDPASEWSKEAAARLSDLQSR